MHPQSMTEVVVASIQGSHIGIFNVLASTVMLFYEVIITLGDEVELIWRMRWTRMTVLYICIRYYALVYLVIHAYTSINTHLSASLCGTIIGFNMWGATVFIPLNDVLLAIRIYALYGQRKPIGFLVFTLWLTETVCVLVFVQIVWTGKAVIKPNPFPGVASGCFFQQEVNLNKAFIASGIAIAFQVVYCVLMLNILMRKNRGRLYGLAPLIRVAFRDGIAYCFSVTGIYILNTLLLKFGPSGALQALGEPWVFTISAIAAGRMVLNLIRTAYRENNNLPCPTEGGSTIGLFTSLFDRTTSVDRARSVGRTQSSSSHVWS